MAIVYPLTLCVLAFFLFVGSCLFVSPEYNRLFPDVGSEGGDVYFVVRMVRDWLPFWVAIPLVLSVVLFVLLRSNSARTTWSGFPRLFSWLPGVSRVIADQRCASLAELLALLVEHNVPVHEGLHLAAGASGDRKLTSAAEQMAHTAEQGQSLTQNSHAAKQFPPFLRWALTSPTEAGDLARTLRLAAQTYRNRAERRTKWLRTATPMLMCVVLAGGVTLLYCLSVFGPLVRLINDLS